MATICFVTDEVMPFTRGGIGAFIRNVISEYGNENSEISLLYSGDAPIDKQMWRDIYPASQLFCLSEVIESLDLPSEAGSAHFEHPLMRKSWLLMRSLLSIEESGRRFDVIEFIDWGGAGFFSLQAKAAGAGFSQTVLSVRIHSTDGVIRAYEPRGWGLQNVLLADFERKGLLDADLVIGHLGPVRDRVAKHYGFGREWLQKVRVELPPVHTSRSASSTLVPNNETDILFTSKLQGIKRPDIFVSGTAEFMAIDPNFRGRAVLAAAEPIAGHSNVLRNLIPNALRERFEFHPNLPPSRRNELIGQSIVVLPNAYEAFCFAAYEASRLGAFVILNGANPAFGDETPWVDGVNCLKFDGTIMGLTRTLAQALSGHSPSLVPLHLAPAEVPY